MRRILQALMLSGLLAAGAAFAQSYEGHGVVKKVDPGKGTVTLKHEAIKALGWPGMTMDFPVKDKALLSSLKPEQAVNFDLEQEKPGRYVITHIASAERGAARANMQGQESHGSHGHGM